MAENSIFAIGDIVQRINQPEAVGIVREIRRDSQTDSWIYVVQFGAQNRAVPEEVIRKFQEVLTPWDAMRMGQLSGVEHFIFTLTFHRLQDPPARIAHSFATTRTLFYPHQFKPLLKFLDNAGKRLLIADDVGLGKTIEAGYILRELSAHEPVDRVLILVPARLAPKWEREMEARFQETFKIVKGSDLARQAERLRQGRELEPFKWIISYESIRPEEIRAALEETEFPIDVLIADEAHRMRNPDTLQHKVGAVLCQASADTVVFLTATPVQNKLEDLWHLVRLLAPEEFSEWAVFQDQMEANRLLLSAQRALAAAPSDMEEASTFMHRFSVTAAGSVAQGGDFLKSVVSRMGLTPEDRRDLVELQADIGRLSPVGHIISRTRKIEALTNRSVRVANWKRVPLTPEEREIYDSVEALCRVVWPGSDSWGFRMSLLMAYRITASCIPAALDYFKEKLSGASGQIWSEEIEETEEEDTGRYTAWSGPARQSFLTLVEQHRENIHTDSKLEELLSSLKVIWEEDSGRQVKPRKIVLFSFFRRTLEYLKRQLGERTIDNRMIHGGIGIPDREAAIDTFLESDRVNVLLTSEVGGEGLDLQKASVVINYDLPWNPMVVEQRIGRVDRIGQEAPTINIVNLVVEGSVEETVLQRLLTKIEIFRGSIGEMDEIIGEEVERLTAQALRGELTEDEVEGEIETRGNALARGVHEAKDLLSRVDGLLTADQGLIDEINSVVGERQIPGERELFQFLNKFLAGRYPGCQLPEDAKSKVVEVDLSKLAFDLEAKAPSLGSDALLFARKIGTGTARVTLSREAAYTHARCELIHLQHALTRYAVAEVARAGGRAQAAFCMRLQRENAPLPPGQYGFLIALLHINSYRPMARIVCVIADRATGRVWSDPKDTKQVVVSLLENGVDAEPPNLSEDEVGLLKALLLATLDRLVSDIDARERRLDLARREQQSSSRRGTLQFLVSRAEDRVKKLQAKGAADFAVRMAHFRLEKAQRELRAFAVSAPPGTWNGIEYDEIAIGLLDVE